MTRLTDKQLARKLEQIDAPTPPIELLEALKAEIPDQLPATLPTEPRVARAWWSVPSRQLALAASVALVIGGGMTAWLVVHEAPPLTLEEQIPSAPMPSEETALGAGETAPTPESFEADLERLAEEVPLAVASPDDSVAPQEGASASSIRRDEQPGARQSRVGALESRLQEAEGEGRIVPEPAPGRLSRPQRELQKQKDEAYEVKGEEVSAAAGVASPSTFADRDERGARGSEANETTTVTSESPPVPERKISKSARISPEEKQRAQPAQVPSSVRARSSGVVADRISEDDAVAEGRERAATALRDEPRSAPAPSLPPSTGGTAEPNDQPYGDVFFKSYGVNPFVDTEDDPFSTFGLDVDTGSFGVVRRSLDQGHLPPPAAVRVEELVNAFDYGDRPPARGDFALSVEGAPSPWAPGERYYLLRLAVKGREVAAADRPPADLVFVVDVSGSMAAENRLGLVKRSLGILLDQLTGADRVGLVVYGDRGEILLAPTSDRDAIRRAIQRLVPNGSTNAEEGLVLAYELAARSRREGATSRIILCSDGVANVGNTGPESILRRIGEEARLGIELTTVGFGMGNYNDVLMEQLADRGNGRYAYVDGLDEARRLFVEELTGTLLTIGAEARAQVEFDPRAVTRYRLLGYENRDIADERFRDDTVDAGEIGAGHTVTALYEVKLDPRVGRRAELGTLRLRYRPAGSQRFVESERTITRRDLARRWEETSPQYRLATVVARFAEILRGSYWARGGDLDELLRRAQELGADFRGDGRVAELAHLIGKARDLAAMGR